MSRRDSRERETTGTLVYGGVPRARLMPPEVAIRRREAGVRRSLIAGLLLVVLLVAAGVVGGLWFSGQAEQRLAEERRVTEELLATQLQFSEVSRVQAQARSITEQRDELLGVEVRWREVLAPYLAVLEGGQVDTIAVQSNAPFSPPLATDGPLRSPRVATVSLTVVSTDSPPAPQWLRAFALVDTYADASISTVVAEDAGFLTTITLNLNQAALSTAVTATTDGDDS